MALLANFVAFVVGSVALALTALSVVDDDFLLRFQITKGRSVLWYLGLLGVIYSVARATIPN